MAALAKATGRAVMAGVPHRRIHKIEAEAMESAMREAVEDLDRGYIFAGGCATGALVADERMRCPRDVVERWA